MSKDTFKTIPQYLLPKKKLTAFAGLMANVTNIKVKNYIIQQFIRTYGVNMSEAMIEDPQAYACFNDFFIRQLKPESRPLAPAGIISPVDGCISEIGAIQEGQLIQAKGRNYSVEALLACDKKTAAQYIEGQFTTLYLAPKDYHRIHMPIRATLKAMTYIPGALFSVQPTTARVVPGLFARNERLAVFFATEAGPMAMVLVGAALVGAIATSWHGALQRTRKITHFDYHETSASKTFAQGEEMGFFKLGSTVIVLFAEGNKVQWQKHLKAGDSIHFGEAMGDIY